jgi:hypothetical protein
MTTYDEMNEALNILIQNIKNCNYVLPLDQDFLISFKQTMDYAYDDFNTQNDFENALIELRVKNAKKVVSAMIEHKILRT